MILQHILIYYSIIIISYDPNNLLTACWFFFLILKKKILSNGTSYLGQKSGSTSLKYKNIKNRESVAAQFCSFIRRWIFFDWICRMSRRRRDSSDEEDGNFKYFDFEYLCNVIKKVTTKQKLTRKPTKIMTQLLL